MTSSAARIRPNRTSAAFGTVVQRHVDLVYSAALRRVGGDHHRAADVTQQVFTDLATKAAKVAAHPVLAGWLLQSTRWAAASLRRAEQRRSSITDRSSGSGDAPVVMTSFLER